MTPRQLGIKAAMSNDTSEYISQSAAGGLGGAAGVMAGLGTYGKLNAMGQKSERKLPQFMRMLSTITPMVADEADPHSINMLRQLTQHGNRLGLMGRMAKYKTPLGIAAGLGAGALTTGAGYLGLRAATKPGMQPRR